MLQKKTQDILTCFPLNDKSHKITQLYFNYGFSMNSKSCHNC